MRKIKLPVRVKFLSTEELNAVAQEIVDLAKVAGVSVAAAGGYAMQVYGSDRFTVDLDVLSTALRPFPDGEPLSFGGRATHAPHTGHPVDVIVRDDDVKDLYEHALRNAKRVVGVPIRVVRPEHLVAMKLYAQRDKDDLDLEFLLLSLPEDALLLARKTVSRFLGIFAAKELDARREEALWKRSKGRV